MKDCISILIPTRNDPCAGLVADLKAQADALAAKSGGAFRYEIVVADDCSTDHAVMESNSVIGAMGNCRLIRRDENMGRARIRNFLAEQARYDYLLFIDGDLFANSPSFVETYAMSTGRGIVYGGTCIGGDTEGLAGNLRHLYEKAAEESHKAAMRRLHPYGEFSAANFLARRETMLEHPFDNRFKAYGYEDVLFGKQMKAAGVEIEHIDNPVRIDTFETNEVFVAKSEEALRTLHQFRDELAGYSNILNAINRIRRFVPLSLIKTWHKAMARRERLNLTGRHPNLTIFKIYKLGFYLSLK